MNTTTPYQQNLGIHDAAEGDDVAAIESLLAQKPIRVHQFDSFGWTPLLWAAVNGHQDCVTLFLRAGASVFAADPKLGRTALHWAARRSHHHLVPPLREAIESSDLCGNRPLHIAARRGSVQMVEALPTPGANVNPRDRKDPTPLKKAVLGQEHEVVEYLRAHGGFE